MRAAVVLVFVGACDSGKPAAKPTPVQQRWKLVGAKTPVEVASEAECRELVHVGQAKALEEQEQVLAERKAAAEMARKVEDQACAEAKILCDISTPAKKQHCDEVRQPLEAKCNEASEARKAADKLLAEPAPASPALTCEPATPYRRAAEPISAKP